MTDKVANNGNALDSGHHWETCKSCSPSSSFPTPGKPLFTAIAENSRNRTDLGAVSSLARTLLLCQVPMLAWLRRWRRWEWRYWAMAKHRGANWQSRLFRGLIYRRHFRAISAEFRPARRYRQLRRGPTPSSPDGDRHEALSRYCWRQQSLQSCCLEL